MRARSTMALVGAAMLVSMTVSAAAADGEVLGDLRDATRAFRDVDAATAAGYGLLAGTPLEECIDEPGEGGMGFHDVNGDLVSDADVNVATPEALLYLPGPGGELELLGVEYVVFAAAWDAENHGPPSLLGHHFHLVAEPNRYELPSFYQLHAWAWKDNPSGTFNDWNPDVRCSSDELPDTAGHAGSQGRTSPGSGFASTLGIAIALILAAWASVRVAKKRVRHR